MITILSTVSTGAHCVYRCTLCLQAHTGSRNIVKYIPSEKQWLASALPLEFS